MEYQSCGSSKLFSDKEGSRCDITSAVSQLWDTKDFSDFTIITDDGTEVKAHKMVLAARSQFFKSMFDSGMVEIQANKTTIREVPAIILVRVLEYMYKNIIEITIENVKEILKASDFLLMDALKNECELFMIQTLNTENAITGYEMANTHALKDLKREAALVIMRCFTAVCQTPAFLGVTVDFLSKFLCNDYLVIENETEVFNAIVTWVAHDENERVESAEKLLKMVRYPSCTEKSLADIKEHKYIDTREMLQYVLTATLYKMNSSVVEPLDDKWKHKRRGRSVFTGAALLLRFDNGSIGFGNLRKPEHQVLTNVPGTLVEDVRPALGPNAIYAVSVMQPWSSPLIFGLSLFPNNRPFNWHQLPRVDSSSVRAMTIHDTTVHMWCINSYRDYAYWASHNFHTNVPLKSWGSTDLYGSTSTNQCILGHKDFLFRIYCSADKTEAFMVWSNIEEETETQGTPWDAEIAARLVRCQQLDMIVCDDCIHISTDSDHLIYNIGTDKIEYSWRQQAFSSLVCMEGGLFRCTEMGTQYKITKWMTGLKCWMPQATVDNTINGAKICQTSRMGGPLLITRQKPVSTKPSQDKPTPGPSNAANNAQ